MRYIIVAIVAYVVLNILLPLVLPALWERFMTAAPEAAVRWAIFVGGLVCLYVIGIQDVVYTRMTQPRAHLVSSTLLIALLAAAAVASGWVAAFAPIRQGAVVVAPVDDTAAILQKLAEIDGRIDARNSEQAARRRQELLARFPLGYTIFGIEVRDFKARAVARETVPPERGDGPPLDPVSFQWIYGADATLTKDYVKCRCRLSSSGRILS